MGVYIQFTSYHIFTVPTKGGVIGQDDISLWEAFGIIVVLEGISIELVGSIVDPHAKYPRGTVVTILGWPKQGGLRIAG